MSDLFWLTDAQLERLKPLFPLSHAVPRGDDKGVLSGIIFINCNGLRWLDAAVDYGPYEKLYNRWVRWGRLGVFARIFTELAVEGRNRPPKSYPVGPDGPKHPGNRQFCNKRGRPNAGALTRGNLANPKLAMTCPPEVPSL